MAATDVTRRARVGVAPPVPDVTAAVLDRLPSAIGRGHRHRLDGVLRLTLVGIGAGQLAVSLLALRGGGDGMAAPVHLAHETGAWNLGLAACFLVVAGLPRLAAGALPFLLSFTAVLSATTLSDLAAGHVHASRAVGHLLLVGGAVLVSVLALRQRGPRTGPARRRLWSRTSWWGAPGADAAAAPRLRVPVPAGARSRGGERAAA